jgi:hypothetical protein
VVISDEASEYVRSRGGVLYVRASRHRCCSGVLTLLDSTTVRPTDISDYVSEESEGIDVRYRRDSLIRPDELLIELRGIVRRRPAAYWNGCAFRP